MEVRQLTLGSLCNGLGGWIIAGKLWGVKTLWESEVNPFCEALMRVRFPEVQQLGDMTQIDGASIPPVDIICAGTPCQNLSISGNRKGLEGTESRLFYDAIRIVRQMRISTGGVHPRFFVWENVPGAFTSGSERGADFRAVLEAIAETDIPMPKDGRWASAGMVQCRKCEIAWRTLDAQYWGIPQRRKRIFLVADFAESDRRAAKILFVSKSVSGDSESCGKERESAAGTVKESVGTTSQSVHRGGTFDIRISSDGTQNWRAHCYETDKSRSLDTAAQNPDSNHGGVAILEELSTTGGQIYDMAHADDVIRQNEISPTLNARMGTGGNQVPIVTESTPKQPVILESNQNHATVTQSGVSPTLSASMGMGGGYVPMVTEMYDMNASQIEPLDKAKTLDTSCRNCFGKQNAQIVFAIEGNGSRESHHGPGFTDNGKMYTLNTVEQHKVAYCIGHDERSAQLTENITDPLTASDYKQPPIVAQVSIEGGQCYAIGNGQLHQTNLSEKTGALNCMHDQIAVMQPIVTEQGKPEACAPMTDEDSTDKM